MNTLLENFTLNDLQRNRRLKNIQRFGTQSMSFSAMQGCIKEFRHKSFKGFIAYSSVWGVDYVLSDPITPKTDQLKATMLFLDRSKYPVFCQISRDYAILLSYLKFYINGLGVENVINLEDFRVGWKNRKCLKSYLSKLSKLSYHVFEYEPDSSHVWQINEQWLLSKQNSKELKFLARPFVSIHEENVRHFYLIKNRHVIGFCTFDPIFSDTGDGTVKSYVLQHLRVNDEAPLGSQDYLILNALKQFKEEGFKEVSLGLSPLYRRDNQDFKSSQLADYIFGVVFRTNFKYKYRTIGEHKDHYKADQLQTYIASRNSFTLKQLFGLMKINNLV